MHHFDMKGARMTIQDIKASKVAGINRQILEHAEQPEKKKKPHKYSSNRTEVNGITFDSEKEANRYKDLLLLLKAGEIGVLRTQVEYELNPGGTHSLKYIADFVYIITATGQEVVEDAKGFRTKEYKKKRRLMKKVHNIEIQEV